MLLLLAAACTPAVVEAPTENWDLSGCLVTRQYDDRTCRVTFDETLEQPLYDHCTKIGEWRYALQEYSYDGLGCTLSYVYAYETVTYSTRSTYAYVCDDMGQPTSGSREYSSVSAVGTSTGQTEYTYENGYDDVGRLIRQVVIETTEDDETEDVHEWNYSGDLLMTSSSAYDTTSFSFTTYTYDSAERLLYEHRQVTGSSGSSSEYHTSFTRDDLGRPVHIATTWGEESDQYTSWTYTYVGDGPWLASERFEFPVNDVVAYTASYDCP